MSSPIQKHPNPLADPLTTRIYSDTKWVFTTIPDQEALEPYQQITLHRGAVPGCPIRACRPALVDFARKHVWTFRAVASRTSKGPPPYMYARTVDSDREVVISVPCMFMHLLYGYTVSHLPQNDSKERQNTESSVSVSSVVVQEDN